MKRDDQAQANGERQTPEAFWNGILNDGRYKSITQKMILEEDTAQADRDAPRDIQEVLALLPPLPCNARILELGAGAGRFTRHLAHRAGYVMACDFVAAFCDENRASCQSLGLHHVDVVCADATVLEPPPEFDLVFVNWLLMYLSDDAVRRVLRRMTEALAPGGWLLFRESCDRTDEGRDHVWLPQQPEYPAVYRSLRWYTETLGDLVVPGLLVRPAEVLPLWSMSQEDTVQAVWLWQREQLPSAKSA